MSINILFVLVYLFHALMRPLNFEGPPTRDLYLHRKLPLQSDLLVTTGGPEFDVQGCDANLLALYSNILCGQHSGVRWGFISVGFDLHASSDTTDGFSMEQQYNMKALDIYPTE